MNEKQIFFAAIAALLTGCMPSETSGGIPLSAVLTAGAPPAATTTTSTATTTAAAAAAGTVMQASSSQPGNEPGKQEVHAASSYDDCKAMLERFKAEGRTKLKLSARINPNASSANDPLRWLCIFTGDDAVDDAFADYRYNTKQETDVNPPTNATPTATPNPAPSYAPRGDNPGHRNFRRSRRRDWNGW